MKKNFFIVLFVLIIITDNSFSFVYALAEDFSQWTPSNWAAKEIMEADDKGLMPEGLWGD